ncbi:asparagine synthase (glutamine-hydrolyzing) [Litorivivens sp.]|uniref:asparagine synthase (glutamine-hydrolyzing) n=1 Tax=Litorivivens sp. TaxID=2020868 RepID=UPI0035629E2B
MCGIVGISAARSVENIAELLGAATKMLRHRGPDDGGVFHAAHQGIGLGHTRLSIQDLSAAGHQPMFSSDGRVVLVFNGEIYNFQELRDQLLAKGEEFHGGSDTEVLLKLYLQQARDDDSIGVLLRKLNGIFAFAIWDEERDALLLARDALGVKPLYLYEDDGCLAFASEVKALMPFISKLVAIDAVAVTRYLSHLWCPGTGTPARGLSKLEPGEAVWLKSGEILKRWTWYRPPVFSASTVGVSCSLGEDQAIQGTREHLRRAVHRQMVADVPVGAFLSGGLDSSAVVAYARERDRNIQCFTIETLGEQDAGMVDDLPYARRVAEHLKVPLHVVRVGAARMAHALEEMVWQLDEPLADPAPLNVLYISRLAREHGIKVLLSGAGGDDLFTGYRRHLALQSEALWRWLPLTLRRQLQNLTLRLDQRRAIGRRLRKLFAGAALEGDARIVNYFRWLEREELRGLLAPEFRAAVAEADATDPMLAYLAELPAEVPPLQRMLALEQRFFLADHNLTYTDKMSMAYGVEVRVPFLDLDLVQFANQVPLRYKQRGMHGKWVLKKALEPELPMDVIWRPKTGFGAPLRGWMRNELRDFLADVLSEQNLRRRGVFDSGAVHSLIEANQSGRVDASYTLLSILCIELWFKRFIDAPSSASSLQVEVQ